MKLKKSEQTREKILRAAMYLYSMHGIEGTTTRSIAKKSNVSNGLINHYFPKSNTLFLETVRFIFEDFKTLSHEEATKHQGTQKIIALLKKNYDLFLRNPHHYRCFALSYSYAGFQKEFKDLHTHIFQSFTETINGFIQEYLIMNGLKKSQEDIQEFSRGMLEELHGSLLFFYFTDHPESIETYTLKHLKKFQKRLDDFFW